MPQINPDRLLGDLKALRKFGRHGTGGCNLTGFRVGLVKKPSSAEQ